MVEVVLPLGLLLTVGSSERRPGLGRRGLIGGGDNVFPHVCAFRGLTTSVVGTWLVPGFGLNVGLVIIDG